MMNTMGRLFVMVGGRSCRAGWRLIPLGSLPSLVKLHGPYSGREGTICVQYGRSRGGGILWSADYCIFM